MKELELGQQERDLISDCLNFTTTKLPREISFEICSRILRGSSFDLH